MGAHRDSSHSTQARRGLVVPLSNVVSTLLLLACAAGAVVGAVTLALRFMRPPGAGPDETSGGAGQPAGAEGQALTAARLAALVLVVAWAAAAGRIAPDGARAAAVAIALAVAGVASGFLVLGPAWVIEGGDRKLLGPGNMGFLVAGLAAAALAVPDVGVRPWIALGAAVGAALPALAAGVFGLERRAYAGAVLAAQAAAIAGAMVWGDRLRPQHNLGIGLALGFSGAAIVVGAAAAAGVPARMGPLAVPVAGGLLTAAVSYPVLALALREPAMAVPAAIGGGMAALLAGVVGVASGFGGPPGGAEAPASDGVPPAAKWSREPATHFLAVMLLILAGGSLLLINRLYGMPGLSLAGIGLIALSAGDARGVRWLAALLPAIFGGRALLHLFLDRTYLRLEGVDVTQTYAFAALILGFVVATALVRFRSHLAHGPLAGGAAVLLLAASPVLVGYFIHILPLAGFAAGVLAAGFGLAALCDGLEAGASRLAPYLVVVTGGAAIAAPFLQEVINAPRQQRILVFLVVSAVALWYAVSTLRSQLQRSAA